MTRWLAFGYTDSFAPPPGTLLRWQDNIIIILETNIGNSNGEQLGFAMERLFEAGALDVWHTPIQMKKNRPGALMSALGPAELESRLAEVSLRETPTLGVRVRPVGRYVADRDTATVETDYGPIRLKRKWLEVWPESHWPGFALRQADVLQSYTA